MPPSTARDTRRDLLVLLFLWALVFMGHNWEQGMKPDAIVNSVVAKHVLSTGDWKVFHYTPSAYPEFYPHPPLAMWLQALAFKTFGVSDAVARFPAALAGLLTVLAVFAWGCLQASAWEGMVAAFVLLTSWVYLKFGGDAFLEGPMTAFVFLGFLCGLRSLRAPTLIPKISYGVAFGFFVGLTFLTKTAFIVYFPLAFLGARLLSPKYTFQALFGLALLATFTAAVTVLPWFYLGNGLDFLHRHWIEIRPRAVLRDYSQAYLPWLHVVRSYWPWFPFFLMGIRQALIDRRKNFEVCLGFSFAFTILIFFTITTHFLEHYTVPFYPAAALVTAHYLAPLLRTHQVLLRKIVSLLVLIYATALAISPFRLRLARTEPTRTAVLELDSICKGQKEILITEKAGEKWAVLGAILWHTDHEATALPNPPATALPHQLLLTHPSETPSAVWKQVPLHNTGAYKAFQPAQSPLCPN